MKDRSDHEMLGQARSLAATQAADDEAARRADFDGHDPECPWAFDPSDACDCGAIEAEEDAIIDGLAKDAIR